MDAQLSAQELVKDFGGLRAVDQVNLDVHEGEIVGLIGPNGAGKSTFFNCLAGDLRPTTGKILFVGEDITRQPPEQRVKRGIARTYQIPLTFKQMSVLENVMVGGFVHHTNRRKVRALAQQVLDFVGLRNRAANSASTLGTPDRKRLEIARALSTKPHILLLDEALAGLTAVETKEAIALLRKINEQGTSLLIVEHVMEVIMTLAHRVLVLHQGALLTQGEPKEVVSDPRVQEAYLGKKK
jgi:branched-chain amino acid transport system ATP-binding protein